MTPQPVRLADGREFAVTLRGGVPEVDWTGLIATRELPGFIPLSFALPADATVSLNLYGADGAVVRQLLTGVRYQQGTHTVKWDGLGTAHAGYPGSVLPAREYTWRAISHPGLGLSWQGYANHGNSLPWQGGAGVGWGGDHGVPCTAAADDARVYLGWTGSEAGKAVVACTPTGEVLWRHADGGMGGAQRLAVANGIVFVQRDGGGPEKQVSLYRLEAKTGKYSAWEGRELATISVPGPSGMAALGEFLVLSYEASNQVVLRAAASGAELRTLTVPAPTALAATPDGKLLVLSQGTELLELDLASDARRVLARELPGATCVAAGSNGAFFVGLRAPRNQILAFAGADQAPKAIGREGGRATRGLWVGDGFQQLAGLVLDAKGQLWAAESTNSPKRFSAWDPATGKLLHEHFGPSHYGASGGTIHPDDPLVMVGSGAEWRLDPVTGRATLVGLFANGAQSFTRFLRTPKGHDYLAVMAVNRHELHGVLSFYERLAPGDYRLRASLTSIGKEKRSVFWTDANDDGESQPTEVQEHPVTLTFYGYLCLSLYLGQDFTIFLNETTTKTEPMPGKPGRTQTVTARRLLRLPVAEFNALGAPRYDYGKASEVPGIGVPSPDGKLVVGEISADKRTWFECWDLSTGQRRWAYPSPFHGVHGSHAAPPAEPGLFRGIFGAVGSASHPVLGTIWAFNSNVGEWHLLSADGFYVSRLFESDPFKMQFPAKAPPGTRMDAVPPGLGGEDFGGNLTQARDGRVFIQAGKTAYWNLQVLGLDQVRELASGKVTLSEDQLPQAAAQREAQLQTSAGRKAMIIKLGTITPTGSLDTDFKGFERISFQKLAGSGARVAACYDEAHLYLGWEVQDDTPWVNGADAFAYLYARGDTVDFQIGVDPQAPKNRQDAGAGDLRLSLGNFQGTPTAVLYQRVGEPPAPMVFSSGVIKEYPMACVRVLPEVRIAVKVDAAKKRYTVVAAVPLASLGLKLAPNLTLRGDFGVTHGDPTGTDTALRTHWNNMQSGLVNDEVYELMMQPKNWGDLLFQ